jgi:hypothetical protein
MWLFDFDPYNTIIILWSTDNTARSQHSQMRVASLVVVACDRLAFLYLNMKITKTLRNSVPTVK